jgi:formate dehydrogenase major subunit
MIRFTLDGKTVEAKEGETLLACAARHGIEIPHLCCKDAPGHRPDGNCRACMVEIEGERTLAPSCRRLPQPGMVVKTASQRAATARKTVLELLLADHRGKADSQLLRWASHAGLSASRFQAAAGSGQPDASHPAILFDSQACILCGLCQRACREIQGNDVIGIKGRGASAGIVFDQGDAMGESSCVGCGECVSACPTGALSAKSYDPGKTVKSVATLCPYCGVGCRILVDLDAHDRVIRVEGLDGPSNQARLCVKGRFGLDYARHPDRLTKPLIRREGVAKDPLARLDPADPSPWFREASWEEALDRAAQGLRDLKAKHGGGVLAGLGSAKGSNEEAYLVQKLVRTGFGNNNVDHCTRLCHAASVAALMEGVGSAAVTAPFTDVLKADVVMLIGARPAENHPVAASFIRQAVTKGTKLLILDPRGQALDRFAQMSLRFTAGQDVALLNAMLNVIIDERLYNSDYIAQRTEGFKDIFAHVAPFTPERMAPICGIEPEVIRQAARTFAKAKTAMILWGMGVSQHAHGTQNARALISLGLICGQAGRPGTGLHPLRGQNNVQGASDVGLIPMFLPDYAKVGEPARRQVWEKAWSVTLDPAPGLTTVEMMDAALDGRLKGLYVMGENPAMSDPDLAHARAALATLDHLVVQDLFLTETAMLADVVLPGSALLEKSGSFTNTNRQVQIARKAAELPGDARQDLWIIVELAKRLGLDWPHRPADSVYEEFRALMPGLKGLPWDRLEREGGGTYPCSDEDQPGQDILFAESFPTPSGKARLVPALMVPPDETPDAEYPLILTTGRQLEHWHTGTMSRRAATLDSLEPIPLLRLHPDELARQGLQSGQKVEVTTRRGTLELPCLADRNVPVGMAFLPFAFHEAAANVLTNPKLDPFGKIPELKYSACRVRRKI